MAKSTLVPLGFVVFLLISLQGPCPAFADWGSSPSNFDCAEYLGRAKSRLTRRYKALDVALAPTSVAFLPKTPYRTATDIQVNLPTDSLARSIVSTKRVGLEGLQYDLHNFGFKRLEQMDLKVKNLLINHMIDPSLKAGLRVNFSPDWGAYQSALASNRWAVHDAVLDKYREVKDYLSDQDFQVLTSVNAQSMNSDVLAITAPNLDVLNLTPLELKENLYVTLQISYYGDKKYFHPTLDGVLQAARLGADENQDMLPFEHRLKPSEALAYRKSFYRRFDRKTTCEVVRYAVIHPVPKAVHAFLLYQALGLLKKREMATAVADVDPLTRRLFRQYGFKDCEPLPVIQSDKPEFLCFLSLTDAAFVPMLVALRESLVSAGLQPL
jgi:hypothetical protein